MLMSLVIFVFVGTVSPGGANALAMASGMRFGFRRSLPLILGLALGLATLAGAAAMGLAAVILASPSVSLILKVAGSVYLLWLAWLIASGPTQVQADTARTPFGLGKGLLMMWLNPKAWTMTLSASASFMLTDISIVTNGMLFSVIFFSCACIALLSWNCAGMTASALIKSQRQWRMVNVIMGILIAATIATLWV